MTAQLILNFSNMDDVARLLQFLKDIGLEKIAYQPKPGRKKKVPRTERKWEGIGSVNLGSMLDTIPNLRDYAYE